jgi:dTDP-4-dehydrorhamnose reductase
MKVAILGTTGMLGHEVERVFASEKLDIFSVNRDKIDAQFCSVEEIQNHINGVDWIINCIGSIKSYIHDSNSFEVQRAISVNSLFPHKLAQAANGAKVIQIATDCVYDGQKGSYVEADAHNSIDVYGKTKSLGEVNADTFINLRCSIIGKEIKNKTSFLEWFLNQSKNAKINGYKNHFWNGVTTTIFAKICVGIMRNNLQISGLQHIVPADVMNKADMLREFKKIFHRNDIVIDDVCTDVSIDRTLSTNNPELNKNIWNVAGYKRIPTINEMIGEME